MGDRSARRHDVREASLREATKIIAEEGVERLSLREVSRRLGVSHQAPYKHFPSRDHILAEVASRAYDGFARHLAARPATDNPYADLREMGRAYVDYALSHPLEYRLMFGTKLPDPRHHPALAEKARFAFSILEQRLAGLTLRGGGQDPRQDALYIWATLHGLVEVLRSDALRTIDAEAGAADQLIDRAFWRLGLALEPE